MAECKSTGHAKASPEIVWEVLADHVGMTGWTPIRSVELEREGAPTPNGVGAIRKLATPTGTIREEIVVFDAPQRLTYRMLSGAPVRDYVANVELTASNGGTDIAWSASFKARLPGVRFVVSRTLASLVKGLAKEAGRRRSTGSSPRAWLRRRRSRAGD